MAAEGRGSAASLHVACASSQEYLPHCAAMLESLVSEQERPVHVHLLAAENLGDRDADRLSEWLVGLGAALEIHRIDETSLRGVPHTFSSGIWYRVLLPELLPDLDRVIYLDSDLIVCDRLDPLWELDLNGHCLAAVTNLAVWREWMERRCAALGIPGVDDYFGAGVLVLNLDRLREGDWMSRVLEYGLEHGDRERAATVDESSPLSVYEYTVGHPERLLFPDQDALNAVLWQQRLKLHPRWHCQLLFKRYEARTEELTEERVAEALRDPAIRHFEGPGHSKPWHPEAEFPEDRELYWKHRRRTPWASP
jgi:lipopolysaccharide biosynthesis glycosyltransferase